jgi:hypothetical protein
MRSTTERSIVAGSDVARVDRAHRVGADDLHAGALPLEVAADTADRPAGAHPGDEMGDPSPGLAPDLGPGGALVRLGVGRVRVLVGLEGAGDLTGEPVGDRVVRLRRVLLDVGRADHHLGAVGTEQADLLLAHLVGHDEYAAVALERGRDGEPVAGVPRGRLDDRPARAQQAATLGVLDHRQADAILDAPARIERLHLGEDERAQPRGDLAQTHQRGVPHRVEDAVEVVHGHLSHVRMRAA